MQSMAARVKARRLEKNLTQKDLASRAGLSFATYRRFETIGEISLKHLLMIAVALDTAQEFGLLFATTVYENMEQVLNMDKIKKRRRGGRHART